jgi:preprotein translocase subunit SecG
MFADAIRRKSMAALRVVLTILFIVVSIALLVVVLMQEGKSAGLGAVAGAAETYWGKAKGRSMEGVLMKVTKWLAVSFIVLAAILNISKF